MAEVNKAGTGTLEFFREVTKYFMDFLETDFHKQRLPKRTIKSRNAGNLLIGFNLKKYESFQQVIEKHIAANFPAYLKSPYYFQDPLPRQINQQLSFLKNDPLI